MTNRSPPGKPHHPVTIRTTTSPPLTVNPSALGLHLGTAAIALGVGVLFAAAWLAPLLIGPTDELDINPDTHMLSVHHHDDGSAMSPGDCLGAYRDGATMIDVRTSREYADGHVACALNVDVMAHDFQDQIAALALDRENPVYLYCRSGNRSGQAAKILRRMGYSEAYNVGSFEALREAGFEVN